MVFQTVVDTWCAQQPCSSWRGRRQLKAGEALRKCHLDVLLLEGYESWISNPIRIAIQRASQLRRRFRGDNSKVPWDKECLIVTGRPEFEYSHTPRDTDQTITVRWLPDALGILAGFAEIMRDHYPKFWQNTPSHDRVMDVWSLLGKLLFRLLDRKNYKDYIAYSKWWSHWYLAKYLEQELPSPPSNDDTLPFQGDMRRFMTMRLMGAQRTRGSKERRRSWRFFNSLQQLKRCSNPVPSDFVTENLAKHWKTMGKKKLTHLMPEVPLEDQEDVVNSLHDGEKCFRLDLATFRKRVRQVVKGFRMPDPALSSASTSAGYDISRDAGGQQAEMYYRLGGVGPMRITWFTGVNYCCAAYDQIHRDGLGKTMSRLVGNKSLSEDVMALVADYAYGDEDQWEFIPPSEDTEKCRSLICGCTRKKCYDVGINSISYEGCSIEVPDELVRHDDLLAMSYRPLDGVWELRGLPLPPVVSVRDMINADQYRLLEDDFSSGLTTCRARCMMPRVFYRRGNRHWSTMNLDLHGADSFGARPRFREGRFQGDSNPVRRHPAENARLRERFPDALRARIVPVLEPWKVRTISAGESFPYWYAKYFQKAMHKYLREIPQFQLVGQKLTGYLLTDFFRRFKQDYDSPTLKMASGDYSGATDGVSSTLTMICHDEFAKFAAPEDRMILDSVIGSHICCYDFMAVDDPGPELRAEYARRGVSFGNFNPGGPGDPPSISPVLQNDGQLMGSVESFPYLCMINFVGSWMALYPEIEDYRDVPILVNGDDIFFFTDDAGYQRWLLSLDFMGFTRSIGKNFYHYDYGYMNSIPFEFNRKDRTFVLFPFYNAGLLYGKQRVSGGKQQVAGLDDTTALGGVPKCMLQTGAIEGSYRPARAAARFLKIHEKYLRQVSLRGLMNYFIPVEFGGLGMTRPDGMTVRVTARQRSLWRACYQWYSKPHLSRPKFPVLQAMMTNRRAYTPKMYQVGVFGRCPLVSRASDIPELPHLKVLRASPLDGEVKWAREFLRWMKPLCTGEISSSRTFIRDWDCLVTNVAFADCVHPGGLFRSLRLPKQPLWPNPMVKIIGDDRTPQTASQEVVAASAVEIQLGNGDVGVAARFPVDDGPRDNLPEAVGLGDALDRALDRGYDSDDWADHEDALISDAIDRFYG